MKSKVIYILPGLFVIVLITLILIGNLGPRQACNDEKEFRNSSYTAIIKQKYTDKENHCYRKLIFSFHGELYSIELIDDTSGFYEYVKVGDAISKSRGTNYITVNRSKNFKLYFDCR